VVPAAGAAELAPARDSEPAAGARTPDSESLPSAPAPDLEPIPAEPVPDSLSIPAYDPAPAPEPAVEGLAEAEPSGPVVLAPPAVPPSPVNLPAIDLEWLDGGRMGADELEGRIVVINFWGVWCGPCVAEAPQIQQLHEKYRDDPGVVFLTINAFDPDLDKVRNWMVENDYDYPVLIDDNFATPSGVRGYPTTWFADRHGRIVFEHIGASGAVFEEFVWRVEMLQAEAGGVAGGEAEGGG
jgi:thiol-disulfide isomerase/thioredoxin